MNVHTARMLEDMSGKCLAVLRREFPCPSCDGRGHGGGNMWSPCYDCFATGFVIPTDEELEDSKEES